MTERLVHLSSVDVLIVVLYFAMVIGIGFYLKRYTNTGEDFFLASVMIDTLSDPCWNDGFDIVGPWQTVSRILSHYLAYDERARRSHVRIYQGEDARKFFRAAVLEELRYQEQKRAQPNN